MASCPSRYMHLQPLFFGILNLIRWAESACGFPQEKNPGFSCLTS